VSDATLRVALVLPRDATGMTRAHVATVATALRAAGHDPVFVETPRAEAPLAVAERLLAVRGFADELAAVPLTLGALARTPSGVVHVFSPADALAARAWRRLSGTPYVCTFLEVLDRAAVANRRGRRELLAAAVTDSDGVLAAGPHAQAALERWLMVDAPLVAADDVDAHGRAYRQALRLDHRQRRR
jgi:hypothetical protein